MLEQFHFSFWLASCDRSREATMRALILLIAALLALGALSRPDAGGSEVAISLGL